MKNGSDTTLERVIVSIINVFVFSVRVSIHLTTNVILHGIHNICKLFIT